LLIADSGSKLAPNIDDKAALYAEVLRVLRPGGWFKATAPRL
jgi:hypothetical protein